MANLQKQSNATRAKLEQRQAWLQQTPGAEREVAEVLRRKEVLQTEYLHLQDRLQSANLAQTFESQQGGERFAMVRSPGIARLPVYPNRVGLIMLGLILGAAFAGIAVAVTESMDANIRSVKDLPLPDGVVVLSSIPFIKNDSDQRRRALMLSSFVAAYSRAVLGHCRCDSIGWTSLNRLQT